jgi:hypothetical protein
MSTFQLSGLPADPFKPLFDLDDEQLRAHGAMRRRATEAFGFPCRVSLEDAAVGEELLLLSFEHQPAASPYRASGPIFVRRGSQPARLAPGVVPSSVSRRLMSLRAYGDADLIVDALVCEGTDVAEALTAFFARPDIAYVHLHNAKRGCFSCLATRVVA